MKKLLIIFSFITCIIMTACSEEESPLLFSVESVSNPENVIMEYYSPDPSMGTQTKSAKESATLIAAFFGRLSAFLTPVFCTLKM